MSMFQIKYNNLRSFAILLHTIRRHTLFTNRIEISPCRMNSQSSNKKKRQQHQQAKTVIIGAGSAGVAAAVKLESYGLEDFIVLEASDRIGGRVCSR